MAIKKKICECGCGREFYGTSRAKWATPYCKVKAYRLRKKES